MDEKGVSNSRKVTSDEQNDGLYPMFLGVCCAFLALKLSPESDVRNKMLVCSAHLFGLFAWKARREEPESEPRTLKLMRKLENAQREIEQLKKIRSEDARANEKVVSIVSAREQSWLNEKKRLGLRIGALMNDLRVLVSNKNKSISVLNAKLEENEALLRLRDESIEEKEKKRVEIEEKLEKASNLVEELKECVYLEARRHSSEVSKHKTAFMELVSNQRHLESEMGRALRQVEAVKQELDLALEQKEQSILMTQRLSVELGKMSKDSEQKDRVLSATLRKSRFDIAEKHVLLKELKSLKTKKNQGELEAKRSKAFSESKDKLYPSCISNGLEIVSLVSDPYSTDGPVETQVFSDVENLENLVNSEAVKYKLAIEQRHHLEVEAFVDQLRLKDEKLETLHRCLLSMELESKRFQAHIEGLNHDIEQLRQHNIKLEGVPLDRKAELHEPEEHIVLQFNPPNRKKPSVNTSPNEATIAHDAVWTKVKVFRRKPEQKRQEMEAIGDEISQEVGNPKANDIVLALQPGLVRLHQERFETQDVASSETSTSVIHEVSKKINPKIDIHALGISYKIKRLKQQLLMLERLTGKQENSENSDKNVHFGVEGFYTLLSHLNKQVDRYQSLSGKIDHLCKRMHENNQSSNRGVAKTEEETKRLELFLEETFQLQRYIVATGQKLMELQAKLAPGFVGEVEAIEQLVKFDMKRFAESIRTLFREVQRGLEVQISRMIGDLEGTLAFDGIIHLKR
ncbi:uncharacterized protein [Henckelia pumila]|uniref:uncharacterized protein n=1 Tax=Henckelia pumila TaxID=405737 RepID=UPI003C6E964A